MANSSISIYAAQVFCSALDQRLCKEIVLPELPGLQSIVYDQVASAPVSAPNDLDKFKPAPDNTTQIS